MSQMPTSGSSRMITQSPEVIVRRNAVWIVLLLAIAASVTSVLNGFAFDDIPVVVQDTRFHLPSDVWRVFGQPYYPKFGGSLYRPLTSLMIGVEWAVGGGAPLPFHVVSIALYAALCVAVYRLAKKLVDAEAAFRLHGGCVPA